MKSSYTTLLSVFVLVSFTLFGCNQEPDCEEGTVDPNCICIEIYAPVCGCDKVTYSNDCHAECAGITDYTSGVCD
ncbi:hypothetical protein OAE93_00450 [bacterium]|nr:hypothetical protein [bacterium]